MNQYFITTAIPYINAAPHLGHAQEFLLAELISRQLRGQGHQVYLQTGTDDNSLKNVLAAEQAQLPLSNYLTQQIGQFKTLLNSLRLNPQGVVHTSSREHRDYVQKFLTRLEPQDIYEGTYQGLYCVGCEDFVKAEELDPQGCCRDHLSKPQTLQETNIFFKLSRYQSQIAHLIESDTVRIYPRSRKKEILNFINSGLQDISISRPTQIADFGVPFPGQPGHNVYVWIDALINYLSGTDYGGSGPQSQLWERSHRIQIIGKNVWKFHAIYWIGLLLSAKIPLPHEILIHGFLTKDGQKISKSLGNALNLVELLQHHDPEILQTYLLGKLDYTTDSDFKLTELHKFYQEELVNQIGNLFPRIWTLAHKFDYALTRRPQSLSHDYHQIRDLYTDLLTRAQVLNKQINDSRIWEGPASAAKTKILASWEQELNAVADRLIVFLPTQAPAINQAFQLKTIIFSQRVNTTVDR